MEIDTESLQAAVSGVLGAGGAAGVARWLFARTITGYDQQNEKQDQKIEELSKALGSAREQLAVLNAFLDLSKTLRSDLEAQINCLRGEITARNIAYQTDIDSMRKDLFIAHERIRKLQSGVTDFSGIEIPDKINRR